MRLLAVVLSLCAIQPVWAQKLLPGDRLYVLHSDAEGTCPSLLWHIIVGRDGVISGLLAWDNRKTVAAVAGAIVPNINVERNASQSANPKPQAQKYEMMVTEIGGQHRNANVSGTIEPNGWLNATVEGSGVSCHNLRVPLFVPASSG
jgi:hypothetical protein